MTTIDDPKVQKLLLGVRSGTDLETSAHYAGLSVSQVYKWLEIGKLESDRIANGEKKDTALVFYFDLWGELTRARAESIVRNVATIQTAASNGTWQAAAWWLERAVPNQYGKKATEGKTSLENKTGKELAN
jgi:hypothetical protein